MWGGVGEGEVALWWRRGEWWGVVERGRGKGRETQVVPPLFCSVEETRKIPDTLLAELVGRKWLGVQIIFQYPRKLSVRE